MYQEWFKEYEKVTKKGKNKMCECCRPLTIGIYPEYNIRIKILGKSLIITQERFLKDKKINFNINFCPMCR